VKFGDAVRFLNGLPGIILAALAALYAFNAYVAKREELAVARAEWRQERDRLRNQMAEEQLAADARDKQRNDSIARLNERVETLVDSAATSGQQFDTAAKTLEALVADNPAAKAALDSLKSAHTRQVLTLAQALAASQAETAQERARVADRDAQLLTLRGNLANAITRADGFERQAHPGALKRVLDSPVTHIVAAGIGYVMGAK
jgi:chromosome segregation ATPase